MNTLMENGNVLPALPVTTIISCYNPTNVS